MHPIREHVGLARFGRIQRDAQSRTAHIANDRCRKRVQRVLHRDEQRGCRLACGPNRSVKKQADKVEQRQGRLHLCRVDEVFLSFFFLLSFFLFLFFSFFVLGK